jgi:tRNA(Arg) A34 adenosine deaminase TadA
MNEDDLRLMRATIEVSRRAKENGNHPFGAVLADDQGNILLEAENTVVTDNDCTAHAETNLIRQAWPKYGRDFLAKCTVYATTEPCAMCAAAIFWSNIRRVVFGLSKPAFNAMAAEDEEDVLAMRVRDLFATGRKPIEVVGPVLEEEAREVVEGHWD